jgi:ABC-type phosphate transport system substrate-binding protein
MDLSLSAPLRRCAALLLFFCLAGLAHAAPVAVGHKNLAGEKIDAPTLKAVFLGKKTAWDHAGRIVLAVLKGDTADAFLKATVEMSASQFANHWRRLAMTGGGTSPRFFDKPDDLRRFVAETPGAIGFLDAASVDDSLLTLHGT